jgi:hypothetical protein
MTAMAKYSRISGLISHPQYEKEAAGAAKAGIVVAFSVAILGPVSLGQKWLWVAPALLFGIPLLVSAPLMLGRLWLATRIVREAIVDPSAGAISVSHTGRVWSLSLLLWKLAELPLTGLAAYLFIAWVASSAAP